MKKAVFVFAVSLFIVSCGPNAEEQAALDALNSELSSLKFELANAEQAEKFWAEKMTSEKDTDLKLLYGYKWQDASDEMESLETEIADVQFKIAQVY